MEKSTSSIKYFWYMLALTPIGGISFPIVRELLTVIPPFEILMFRLLGGFIALSLVNLNLYRHITLLEIKSGLLTGVFLGAAMSSLTYGMLTTLGGQAAFILSLQVIFVPLIRKFIWQDVLGPRLLIGITFSFLGLVIMTFNPQGVFTPGDLWILFGALMVALFGIYNSKVNESPSLNIKLVGMIQLLVAGTIPSLFFLSIETWETPSSFTHISCIVFLVLISTAFRYSTQLKLQRHVSATITGLIFTLEPVWASLFCWILLSENMSIPQLLGGGIILLGLVVVRLKRISFKNLSSRLIYRK